MEKVKFFLLDIDYVVYEERTIIRLWGVTEDGRDILALKDEHPYFFVLISSKEAKREIEKLLETKGLKVKEILETKRYINGRQEDLLKIVCFRPQDTQKIRDIVKLLERKRGGTGTVVDEYEYAINFYRRFLIEKKIDGNCWLEVEGTKITGDYDVDLVLEVSEIKVLEDVHIPDLKTLAFDIETHEVAGKKRIVMASFFGRDMSLVITDQKALYPEWVKVVKDEKEIIEEIIRTIFTYKPHMLVTYYGDSFDFQVLDQRCEINRIKLFLSRDKTVTKFQKRARVQSARLNGIVHVDLFNFISNILSPSLQTEVLSLDAVSSELLGDRKIEMDYNEMLEAWRKGRDLLKLASYALKDAELTYRLLDLLLPQMFEISKTVGQILFDTSRMTYGQLVEWYLSRRSDEEGAIIPNQPKFEDIQRRREETFTGGFVKEPIGGIHENIAVLDFRSLYPSIIVTYNISPETLNCGCCKERGNVVPDLPYYFCNEREGFIPRTVKDLIEKRQSVKEKLRNSKNEKEQKILDSRQYALKIIANAIYGYFSFPASKWYSKECAESCATFGRFWIKKTIEEAEKKGFTIIYGDTDSLFLTVKEKDIKKETSVFMDYINGMLPGVLELDVQGFYKRAIFIPKGASLGVAKKKYALLDEKGNLLIRGLETVRRDWCNLAKETQRKVLEYVLKENDIEGAKNYVREIIERVRKKNIPLRDLILYEELTKPLESYKQEGPHVVAARKIKKRGGEVGEGMVVMFVITEGEGSISERAEPVEHVSIDDIDIDYYITHQIIPAALRVMQVLGVAEQDLI